MSRTQNPTFSQVCRSPAHLESVLSCDVVYAEMLLPNSSYDQRCFDHTVDDLNIKQKDGLLLRGKKIGRRVIKEIIFAKNFFYRPGMVVIIIWKNSLIIERHLLDKNVCRAKSYARQSNKYFLKWKSATRAAEWSLNCVVSLKFHKLRAFHCQSEVINIHQWWEGSRPIHVHKYQTDQALRSWGGRPTDGQ